MSEFGQSISRAMDFMEAQRVIVPFAHVPDDDRLRQWRIEATYGPLKSIASFSPRETGTKIKVEGTDSEEDKLIAFGVKQTGEMAKGCLIFDVLRYEDTFKPFSLWTIHGSPRNITLMFPLQVLPGNILNNAEIETVFRRWLTGLNTPEMFQRFNGFLNKPIPGINPVILKSYKDVLRENPYSSQ